jgi:GT2 family glycosyltransferase
LLDLPRPAPGAVAQLALSQPKPRTERGPLPGDGRPRAEAKFLAVGDRRLWVRGVTYGTFAPDAAGERFPPGAQVARDFAMMVAHGVNAVRVYTPPPRWLLDEAAAAGLWVLAGLPWEQHIAFLSRRRRAAEIVSGLREEVGLAAGHPAILGYAVGNEIPASIVRWHGRRAVERFLNRLCSAVRDVDPQALVTYVNFPGTEYLAVPAADFVSFNVYLEDHERLAAYVARLHNVGGERPLLLTEIGLDSRRNGPREQAHAVARQIETAFSGGCAGAFVFAWTDEWHRGDDEVLDWDFGLTDRRRTPKPALCSVADAFATAPPAASADAPTASVIVCTHNGSATLHECLAGALALDYPRFEVILVDDGSSDDSAVIGLELGVRVISTPNCGLSAARNTGLEAADGEIVAYIDDDARPDENWLTYLAGAFEDSDHAAIGGPNIPPVDEEGVAACVANTPGGPTHVLLSDTEAEHLPGCNMAFRREALLKVGGFDAQFRIAGDDVDICWRLREAGMTLGFHPAAIVWHRRRATIRRFWRQQRGYGRAEALLERKWPEKYNAPGHPTWGGRLYGRGTGALIRPSRVYFGTWGTAAFQGELERPASRFRWLAAAPEWYLVIAALLAAGLLGALWAPLMAALIPCALASGVSVASALRGTRSATFGVEARRPPRRRALMAITVALHLLQPAARLVGRLGDGLVPWRRPRRWRFTLPMPRRCELWSGTWKAPEERLRFLDAALREHGARVRIGDPCDRWDLHTWGGALGGARLRVAVEEHGRGRQLVRCRVWPRIPRGLPLAVVALATAGTLAAAQHAWLPSAILTALWVMLVTASVCECGIATAGALGAVAAAGEQHPRLVLVGEDDAG